MCKISEKINKLCSIGTFTNFDLFRQKIYFQENNKSFSEINTQLFITEPQK